MKKFISIILAIIICAGMLAVIASAASVDVMKGDGEKVSSDYLTAKQVKLSGRIYETSEYGAYFTNLSENSNGTYIEDSTVFVNYNDADSLSNGSLKYVPVTLKSTKFTSNVAWKVRINPYRLYNDIRASASNSKVS
ncbi:MAG: hypothetical protein IKJ70_05320 [Clostridia bacterium]|nr:hypothetical protein [Clostridia bacterium]